MTPIDYTGMGRNQLIELLEDQRMKLEALSAEKRTLLVENTALQSDNERWARRVKTLEARATSARHALDGFLPSVEVIVDDS